MKNILLLCLLSLLFITGCTSIPKEEESNNNGNSNGVVANDLFKEDINIKEASIEVKDLTSLVKTLESEYALENQSISILDYANEVVYFSTI